MDDTPTLNMIEKILDASDKAAYTFDRNRRVIYANEAARRLLNLDADLIPIGAAEKGHFEQHKYFDTEGNPLPYPKGSVVELAFQGKETKNLVIEHRNLKEREHQWINISCKPVFNDKGEFEYGIVWYENISERRSGEDKLRFMLNATKVLSLTTDFRERLKEKARVAVPTLADWCAIDIVNTEGAIERVVVVHRDPNMIRYVEEFEKRFPPDPNSPTSPQSVIQKKEAQFVPVITDEMIAADALSPEHAEAIRKLQLSSIMVIPIISVGKALGSMTLAYAESGRTYSPDDLAFFKEFCDHLGVLLENARLYDEITRRDRAKDMFLASLSHELRNPLAPIRSSLELMRLRGIPQDLSEDVATVEHQFGHMTRLLGDLLDVTRYTQEKIILSTVLLDPKIIIERVMTAAAPIARAGGVVLEQSFPPEQLFIEADPVRLEQAITNLVTNAIKFTPSGGKVRAALAKDDTDALITVADTGTGIEKVDLPNIFDMYYQGNREKGRLSSGLGIGLYLVQKIVDLHGGRIEALSSGSGKGSTFIIRIPLSEKRPGGEKKKNGITHARGLRVLVVDDNVAAADSLVRLLNLIGAQAEAAYSGRDVISRTDIDSFDSIVMDIGMPGLSGYELTNMLRKMGYAKQIVALTGYGLKEDREKALREGFSAHLTKPVGIAELRAVFETLS